MCDIDSVSSYDALHTVLWAVATLPGPSRAASQVKGNALIPGAAAGGILRIYEQVLFV